MKYFHYIYRNARRNPIRSLLTIASVAITLFLMMILVTFSRMNKEVMESIRIYNRIVVMNSQGFAGRVPIARVREVAALPGVVAATPFSWYGGKFREQVIPFAQFAVDPDTIFTIYDELTIPPEQLKAFRADKAGCVIGRKTAENWGLKVGDPLPLKGGVYPFDLNLTVRGIFDGPPNRDLRTCMFRYDYLDEGLKRANQTATAGNAGIIIVKCKSGDAMAGLCRKVDTEYANSDNPTRTQTEEAFGKMFGEMMRDFQWLITFIGAAVIVALVFVAGNAMAMALRERTTEVAILKAIGYGKGLVLALVLSEAVLVAGLGGVLGSLGCKLLCDVVDVSKFTAGMLPFFFVSWRTALFGLAVSLAIGLVSGIIPALLASRLSVINGLRKVV
jgi:putative ABC transport system permease protein